MTRAFAACLMLMCVRLAAVSYYSDEFNQNNCRLQIKCTEVHLVNNLGFYCSRASALLDKILGVKDIPKRKLRVLELVEGGDTGEKSGDDVFQVCFRVNEEELDFSHRLFSELMRRRLFPLCKGGVVTKPFFEAVTAGVCYRYTRGRQALSGYYEPDYEIARNQFMRKEFPKLNVLMGNSVSPKQRYFFELYMMHCDLMLLVFETLQNEQEDCVLKILQAEQAGENPFQALGTIVSSKLEKGETVQKWYERMVFKVSRRRRRQSSEEIIAEKVLELETVPVIGYEGGTALRRVPLEDVPNVLHDYHSDVQGVLRLEKRFRDLRESAPYLLREPLEKYALAMNWIREGNLKRFRKEIGEARRNFQSALARQKKMNEAMNKYEQEHIPALKRFVDYVLVSRFYHELLRKIYPYDPFIVK